MKLESLQPPVSNKSIGDSAAAQSARERAIAKFMGNAAASAPQVNPNAITPEDLSAVKPAVSETITEIASTSEMTSATDAKTTQTDTSEEPVQEVTSDQEPPLSSRYAQLARKEKALRAQMQQIKAKEAEIAKRETDLQDKSSTSPVDLKQYVSKDELKQNAWKTLQELGVTYDQLTQEALNGPSQETVALLNEIKSLREELNTVKSGQEETRKSIAEQQTQAYQQAVAQLSREVKQLVAADPAFEAIAATKAEGEVVKLIERTFAEDGTLLSVEEAAQMVEDHLAEKYTKLANLKKIQSRLAANAKQATPAQKQAAPAATTVEKQQIPPKTLSNSMGGQRPLSSRERAILAFEGKLKQQG